MNTANFPWVESPFFEELLKSKQLSDKQIKIAREYNENGFVVIPGLIPEALIDSVRKEAEQKGFNPDFPVKTLRDASRVQDLWQASEPVRELSCYPELMDILQMLYGRTPLPFQTLNFSVGSQQKAHSDTIHFSSLPPKFMCGVWWRLKIFQKKTAPYFTIPVRRGCPNTIFHT